MITTRSRRIARRTVMALAVVVLIPVFYVCSVISASFAWGAGWIPIGTVPVIQAVYTPLTWYTDHGYPGSDSLEWAAMEAESWGERLVN